MKNIISYILPFCLLLAFATVNAQNNEELPEFQLSKAAYEAHLKYIASDELKGRDTGSEGEALAADYIANHFEKHGLKPADSLGSWFQEINFDKITPANEGSLSIENTSYAIGGNCLILDGDALELTDANAVFANYGWANEETGFDDYDNLNVKGKIVFVLSGNPESNNPFAAFAASDKKKKIAAEKGAIGLIEIFRMNFPWAYLKQYLNSPRLQIHQETQHTLLYGWLKEGTKNELNKFIQSKSAPLQLSTNGVQKKTVIAKNVIGILEGTDPERKNNYVAMTAHYDHVGIDANAREGEDSIFNGARDNAIGTVALMAAAEALGKQPPAHSTLFIAFTAEEKGLLGSEYYVNHPVIPLEKTIFNLNNDGGGYNSTDHVAIIGYGRTGTDAEIDAAAKSFELQVAANPMPEENLFDRSDNVNFARKGVPAIDFAPGALSFDEQVTKYYHQVADNPETIDFDYLIQFCKAYAHAARLIANRTNNPVWTTGDKYEPAGKALYGLE